MPGLIGMQSVYVTEIYTPAGAAVIGCINEEGLDDIRRIHRRASRSNEMPSRTCKQSVMNLIESITQRLYKAFCEINMLIPVIQWTLVVQIFPE